MIDQLKLELEQIAASGRQKEFHPLLSRENGFIEIKGKKVADFTNWDFLNLNSNRKFMRSAQEEIEKSGVGALSSRLSSGTSYSHLALEKRIAGFLGTQSAVVFSSKNQAVFSLFTALVGEADAVFYDEQMQSPVSDACYLVNAPALSFNSSNLPALETELAKVKQANRKIIVVESVSPGSGKKNDLSALLQIALRQDAHLVVDESYALGAIGLRGAGLCEELGCISQLLCVYGSMGQGLAAYGAFVAGGAIVSNYLIQRSKTFQNEVSLPPALAAAVESGINIIELAHLEREKLRQNTKRLRDGLTEAGFLDAGQSDSMIVSIMVGKFRRAREFADILFQRGFLAEAVSLQTPLTEVGMLRFIVQAAHSPKSIDALLQNFIEIYSKIHED